MMTITSSNLTESEIVSLVCTYCSNLTYSRCETHSTRCLRCQRWVLIRNYLQDSIHNETELSVYYLQTILALHQTWET